MRLSRFDAQMLNIQDFSVWNLCFFTWDGGHHGFSWDICWLKMVVKMVVKNMLIHQQKWWFIGIQWDISWGCTLQ